MSLEAELAAANASWKEEAGRSPAVSADEGELSLLAGFGVTRVSHYAAAEDPVEERLRVLNDWTGAALGRIKGEAVFTDATTLYAAYALMSERGGGVVTAPTLLDLDTFVRSAVLYDQIICLQWGKVPQEINKSLGEDIVTPIAVLSDHNPGPRGGIAGALSDLFDEVTVDLWRLSGAEVGSAAFDDAKELCRCWELMLGIPVDVTDLDGKRANRNQDWASDGLYNVGQLVSAHRDDAYRFGVGPRPSERWAKFIDECNLRALFNTKVARMLGLPYAANSTRLPLRFQQIRNAVIAHDCFLDLAEIQRILNERTRAYVRPGTVELPVLLTAVIERATEPTALWEQVARLRKAARRYRGRRAELLDALARGDVKAVKKLEKALDDDGGAFRRVVGGTAEVALNATLLATGNGIAFLILQTLKTIKALSGRDTDVERRLLNQVVRGDQWFVTKLGESAERLLNGLDQVERLWRPDPLALQICAERLDKMRQLHTAWPVRPA